jgi:hypothetical protein
MSRINKYNLSFLLARMKVEIEMYIDEDDETIVMEKVSSLTKQAKETDFKIGKIEFKGSKHRDKEDNSHHKHHHDAHR